MAITQVGAWQNTYVGNSVTIPAGNAGDWIIFGCSWNDQTINPTASDPTNGAYTATLALPVRDTTGGVSSMNNFYKENVVAASVVVTLSTSPPDCGAWGGRFRGIAPSSSVGDKQAINYVGATTTNYSLGANGPLTVTASAGDAIFLLFASEFADCGAITPDTGYSQLAHTATHTDAQLVNLSAAGGATTPFFTGGSANTHWLIEAMVVFQAAAGGIRMLGRIGP